MTGPTPVVEIRDGTISLSGRPVLRGIDLAIRRGEVVAILGSNGSGKTTLVRGLIGLLPWSRGEVRLFGRPLPRFRDWSRVGYVPQRTSAASGVPSTVTEVVSSGRLSRRQILRRLGPADRTAVRSAIRAVGLDDRRHDVVGHLSGGQQQRVLIARALAGEPDLFVLDEPNAGVDYQNQVGLAETLRPLVEAGSTVLLVLHELGPLATLIDRAVVVRDGRIVYDGPPPAQAGRDDHHDHHVEDNQPDRVPIQSSSLRTGPLPGWDGEWAP